jgi:hypothetical protein
VSDGTSGVSGTHSKGGTGAPSLVTDPSRSRPGVEVGPLSAVSAVVTNALPAPAPPRFSVGMIVAGCVGLLAIGFRPDVAEGLPTDAEHPAVFDWDADGAPGATVTVRAPLFGAVDVYVVQSSRGLLDGRLQVRDGVAVSVEGACRHPTRHFSLTSL